MFSPPAREPTGRQADVIALHDTAGWTYRDVAEQLSISRDAAKSRRKRARQRAQFGVSRDALRKREKNSRPALQAA